ncbi:hypothetical protein [uncultured Novosphingobium sp.]|uniref:hypothetical protein n=1 Tax=uncultured Novosphingobium sp. TaxID=292277 RepID=UPI00259AC21A|nr:hypothetical protein [uncultured Novosphingobium sp.]
MKTLTNHTQGPRGINTDTGTVWIEPGETVEIDPKTIKGALPDLGKAPDAKASAGDSADLKALKAQVADLTKQVEDLTTERDALTKDKADLTKQVEDLTKPAK